MALDRTGVLLLGLLAGVTGTGATAATPATPSKPQAGAYVLPDTAWSVTLTPAVHPGPPFLKVAIDPALPWPAAGRGVLEYRATLLRPDGTKVMGAAWLTETSRADKIALVTAEHALLFGADVAAAEEELRRAAGEHRRLLERLQRLADASREELDALRAGVAELAEPLEPTAEGTWAPELFEYRVLLEPVLDGEVLKQEAPPRAPEPPRYTWGQPVVRPGDPCLGRTPEECVRERLRALRDRFCSARTPQGGLRFPFHCIVLALRLSEEPPTVHVRCLLEGAAASTALDSLEITVNGEYFLTRDCLEGVLLHELEHVFDTAGGRAERVRERARAARRLDELLARLSELWAASAPNPPDPAATAPLLREIAELGRELERLRVPAAVERLQTECRALFAVLDNADFLGPRADVLPWILADIGAMIHQQVPGRRRFGVADEPEVVAALCSCLRRMREWLDAHPDARDAFARKQYTPTSSWNQYLDDLLRLYECP
jgi:hypothetical protein